MLDRYRIPGSVFAPREVLIVTIAREGNTSKAVSARVAPRKNEVNEEDSVEQRARILRDFASKARSGPASVPKGTEPCDIGAWSDDKDPQGLNVRAEPSANARILGTLPPPFTYKAKDGSENTPEGGWQTEFKVIGHRKGWFLIEGARPPGSDYEEGERFMRAAPKPFKGQGWVAGNKIGAQFANGGGPSGSLHQAPHLDARSIPAKGKSGEPISVGDSPKRIFACSGFWALVETDDGTRGWWRALCSNQVTNCS